MKSSSIYRGHRFPPAIISLAMRSYFRFSLSLRDIEELLLERGVIVSYEWIWRWCDKFGARFAAQVKTTGRIAKTWHLDEMFVRLRGGPYWLWRAVDEQGQDSTSCCKSVVTPLQPNDSSNGSCATTRHRGS